MSLLLYFAVVFAYPIGFVLLLKLFSFLLTHSYGLQALLLRRQLHAEIKEERLQNEKKREFKRQEEIARQEKERERQPEAFTHPHLDLFIRFNIEMERFAGRPSVSASILSLSPQFYLESISKNREMREMISIKIPKVLELINTYEFDTRAASEDAVAAYRDQLTESIVNIDKVLTQGFESQSAERLERMRAELELLDRYKEGRA